MRSGAHVRSGGIGEWGGIFGIVQKGKPISAIYTISKDEFVFVYAQDGAARPTDFRADAGQAMRRFMRRPQRFS